ncbi:MAG: maleylacetoacetate isomerase [Gammaproteobacteria bacterium]|nr:maleylacetoacetate isomerase [Gammaproteobacteria bacterium]
MSELALYTYFRSSAAYRVRIALNLKGLSYEPHFIHLIKASDDQWAEYRKINPQGLIPMLIDKTADASIPQSLAILEYLEECYPTPSLLPVSPAERAFSRSLALLVCCEIHPLNNLRVLGYLKDIFHIDEAARMTWYRHWIAEGLASFEARLAARKPLGPYCCGDAPTMADACLIPQLYNAQRFDCDLTLYPILKKINANCMELEAFSKAAPENQPDHE